MSTLRHPVGPRSSRVYWRRRLLVLIVLIAIVAIVLLIVVRPGSGSGASPGASPSASAADDSASASASPSTELVAGADCLPENVRVDAITDNVSYQAGEIPQLSFTVTNTAAVSCVLNVGTTQQTFVITSGDETYWSSKDCESGAIDADLTLEPNLGVTSTPIAWDRTRSSASTCDTAGEPVPAGGATYNLVVTLGAVAPSALRSFLLN